MSLGNKLRELRISMGINQKEIAKMLNIDRSTYGKYETGDSSPDYDKLTKLADYFNVTIDYLLGRSDRKTTNKQKPNTIAAHLPEGVKLTEEEQKQLDDYIQFLLSRRKK